jgi:hypothetical protein
MDNADAGPYVLVEPSATKRKYEYTEEKKNELRIKSYQDLHDIDTFFELASCHLPQTIRVVVRTLRETLKSLIADQLHKKEEGQSLRILWEHELESVLKSLHENDWAHYPKDQHN